MQGVCANWSRLKPLLPSRYSAVSTRNRLMTRLHFIAAPDMMPEFKPCIVDLLGELRVRRPLLSVSRASLISGGLLPHVVLSPTLCVTGISGVTDRWQVAPVSAAAQSSPTTHFEVFGFILSLLA